MRVIQVSRRAVMIWFSEEDAPPLREMAALVRRALSAFGRAPWPRVTADCFAAENETLLIARPGEGEETP